MERRRRQKTFAVVCVSLVLAGLITCCLLVFGYPTAPLAGAIQAKSESTYTIVVQNTYSYTEYYIADDSENIKNNRLSFWILQKDNGRQGIVWVYEDGQAVRLLYNTGSQIERLIAGPISFRQTTRLEAMLTAGAQILEQGNLYTILDDTNASGHRFWLFVHNGDIADPEATRLVGDVLTGLENTTPYVTQLDEYTLMIELMDNDSAHTQAYLWHSETRDLKQQAAFTWGGHNSVWVQPQENILLYPTVIPTQQAAALLAEETTLGTASVLACFEPLYNLSVYLVLDKGSEVINPDAKPALLAFYEEYTPEEPFVWVIDEHRFMHLSLQYTDASGQTYLQQYSISGQKYYGGESELLDAPDWQ